MPKQVIGIGSSPNDKTGDVPRTIAIKANANFSELYDLIAALPTVDNVLTSVNASLALKAPLQHTHNISDVSGLSAAIGDLQSQISEIDQSLQVEDIQDLTNILAGKAPVQHSHVIAEVAGLQAALDAKASTTSLVSLTSRVAALEANTAPTATLAFTTAPSSGVAGSTMAVAVSITGTISGNVSFKLFDQSGIQVGTTTSVTPSAGSASTTFTRPALGVGYTVSVSASGATPITSSSFFTTNPIVLAFTTHPSSGTTGATTNVAVSTTGSPATVSFQIKNSSNANVGSAVSAPVTNNAASATLTLPAVGTGYYVQASATGATSVNSNTFASNAAAALTLTWAQEPTGGTEGTATAVSVTVTGAISTVSFQVKNSSNVNVGSAIVASVSGTTASATLSRPAAGSGYTVVASATGASSITSTAFATVTATPSTGATITSVTLQNGGAQTLDAGIARFGMVFKQGEMPAGSGLAAKIGATAISAQVTKINSWPDGSYRICTIAVARPSLAVSGQVVVDLSRLATVPAGTAINLSTASLNHTLTVAMNRTAVSTTNSELPLGVQTIDVLSELRLAIAAGAVDYWTQGPLVTEGRVIIYLDGSQRIVADISCYTGNGMTVDLTYANDRALEAVGGRVTCDWTTTLNGVVVEQQTNITQYQYQNWDRIYNSNTKDGWQDVGGPTTGWLNVKHDIVRLQDMGVFLHYDTTLPVPGTWTNRITVEQADPNWKIPIVGTYGLVKYEPTSGGRPEIGFNSAGCVWWLIGQRNDVARYGMAHGRGMRSFLINYWDRSKNKWLSVVDRNALDLGKVVTFGSEPYRGLTQIREENASGYKFDMSHQPSVAYIPFILTTRRIFQDAQVCQGQFNLFVAAYNSSFGRATFPYNGYTYKDFMIWNPNIRAAAWQMREYANAGWVASDNMPEGAYLLSVQADNFKMMLNRKGSADIAITGFAPIRGYNFQGESTGWLDPGAKQLNGGTGAISQWQQEYWASVVLTALARKVPNADEYFNWWANYGFGRMEPHPGWQLRDASHYSFVVASNTVPPFVYVQTWGEHTTAALALIPPTTNGDGPGWPSNDVGGAMSIAAEYYRLTGSQRAYDNYMRMLAFNPPSYKIAGLQNNVQLSLTIPGQYTPT